MNSNQRSQLWKMWIFNFSLISGLYGVAELTRCLIDYQNKFGYQAMYQWELVFMWTVYLAMMVVIKLGLKRI